MKFSKITVLAFASVAIAASLPGSLSDEIQAGIIETRQLDLPVTEPEEEEKLEARAPTKCRVERNDQGTTKRDIMASYEEPVANLVARSFYEEEEQDDILEDDLDERSEDEVFDLTARDYEELEARGEPACGSRGQPTKPGSGTVITGLTQRECANRCLCPSETCRSFSWALRNSQRRTGVCTLYSKTLPAQGFRPGGKGNKVWWARKCWKAVHPTPTAPVHTNGPRAAEETGVTKRGTLAGIVVDALAGLV